MLGKGVRSSAACACGPTSFNEARAVCSGKASAFCRTPPSLIGFNEARAVCSGKAPWIEPPARSGWSSFNEARAVCSGKVESASRLLNRAARLQ